MQVYIVGPGGESYEVSYENFLRLYQPLGYRITRTRNGLPIPETEIAEDGVLPTSTEVQKASSTPTKPEVSANKEKPDGTGSHSGASGGGP